MSEQVFNINAVHRLKGMPSKLLTDEERAQVWAYDMVQEVARAMRKHPCNCNSAHHHFAVLLEEVDELKTEVWTDGDQSHKNDEAIQVGAMAIRFLIETNRPKS